MRKVFIYGDVSLNSVNIPYGYEILVGDGYEFNNKIVYECIDKNIPISVYYIGNHHTQYNGNVNYKRCKGNNYANIIVCLTFDCNSAIIGYTDFENDKEFILNSLIQQGKRFECV